MLIKDFLVEFVVQKENKQLSVLLATRGVGIFMARGGGMKKFHAKREVFWGLAPPWGLGGDKTSKLCYILQSNFHVNDQRNTNTRTFLQEKYLYEKY